MGNNKWNRKGATTTDGLDLIRDQDYEYAAPVVRQEYDPSRGSSRQYVWTDDANCNGSDPDLFQVSQFGDPGTEDLPNRADHLREYNMAKINQAIAICEGCPVRATCLETAETSDLHWSVRGGQIPKRLDGQKAIPVFPIGDYFEWECKRCGGSKYSLHSNKGVIRKYCLICSSD